jgi:hypothetical protein
LNSMTSPILPQTRYGRWVTIKPLPVIYQEVRQADGHRSHRRLWLCRCDCGTIKPVDASHLRAGRTKSCSGCMNRPGQFIDGRTKTAEYLIWHHMIRRCEKPTNSAYKNYGGRGITICKEWRSSFPRFLADMGPRPTPQHSIERKNNNGNYEPSNCVWLLKSEQNKNRRCNRYFTINGETACLAEWAKRSNINSDTVASRLKRGMSIEDALALPSTRSGYAVRVAMAQRGYTERS